MLAVALLWASNNVITKAALDRGLEPLIYIVLRFALVTVLLFPYLWLREVPLRVQRADVPRFVVSGLCGFALYNMLYVVGLSHTSAFSAAILVSLAPIFILMLSAVFGLETVRRLQWVGVAISFLGVGIFVGDKLLAGRTGDRRPVERDCGPLLRCLWADDSTAGAALWARDDDCLGGAGGIGGGRSIHCWDDSG